MVTPLEVVSAYLSGFHPICLYLLTHMQHLPAIFLVDSGIELVLPHTHISWLGYKSPARVALTLAILAYMNQAHLPPVYGPVLCLCPAGSGAPPPSQRNEDHGGAIGRLNTCLGLSVFPL